MTTRSARILLLAAIAVGVTACASNLPDPTPPSSPSQPIPSDALASIPPSQPPTVTDTSLWMTFDRPSSWTVWKANGHDPMTAGPEFYLATDPLLPSCATAPEAPPNPPDASGMACAWPLASLSPDGVLVVGYTTRILMALPSAGEVINTNGDTAPLVIDRPGNCAEIGGDESIGAMIPMGMLARWSNVGVSACLRGPDLAASEAQVRAMFSSIAGWR